MNSRLPLARGRGGWQYISLPRGTDRTAGTLRTGYREAGPAARLQGPPGLKRRRI